jgi:hypothetical protein
MKLFQVNQMLDNQVQEQYVRRLHAAYTHERYLYYVVGLDPDNREYAPVGPNMTEDQVRARAAAGGWPGMADIEEVLLQTRKTAHKQLAAQ